MSITSSNQIKTLLLHRSLEWLTISPRIKTCCPQCTPLFSIVYCLLLPLQVFSADRKFASRSRSRSLGALLCFVKPRGFVSSVPRFGTCWSFNDGTSVYFIFFLLRGAHSRVEDSPDWTSCRVQGSEPATLPRFMGGREHPP